MKKSSSEASSHYTPIELPDFQQTYVDRNTVEAHILRAQAISDIISEVSSFFTKLLSVPTDWFTNRTKGQSLQAELNSFSDRELADIGISRSDIKDIVAGTYVSRRTGFDTTNVKVLKRVNAFEDQKHQKETSIAA